MDLSWETLNALSGRMAEFGWQVLWQSSLLIVALWLLDCLLKLRVRASVRYALWLLVLLKLLLPPSFSAPSSLAWWIRPSHPEVESVSGSASLVRVTYREATLPREKTPDSSVAPASPPGLSAATLGLLGSLLATVGLLSWMVWRQRQVLSILRRASPAREPLNGLLAEAKGLLRIRSRVRLLVTHQNVSPALCGLVRPGIILPESVTTRLTPAQLRAVLLHELVHLKRGDVWISCAQSLLQIVFWWHPLLWMANARIRRLREEAVDDAVTSTLSGEPADYAVSLLEVARLALRRPFTALGFVGILESSARLKQRVERLLSSGAQRQAGAGLVSIVWVTAFAAVALPMGPATERETSASQQAQTDAALPEQVAGTNGVLMKWGDFALTAKTVKVDVARGVLMAQGAFRIEGNEPAVSEGMHTRVFKVDPNAFREGVLRTLGQEAKVTNTTAVLAFEFFRSHGIDLSEPPKSFYYKPREGTLLVRATLADLDAIENAIEKLGMIPAGVRASIKVAMLSRAKAAEFWAGLPLGFITNNVAALNQEDEAQQWDRLKQLAGPGTKAETSIITRSGRQAQIHIGESRYYIKRSKLNLEPTPVQRDAPDVSFPPRSGLQTNEVPVGLTVDFLPYVALDAMQMHITAAFTEFLGYDDPGAFVPQDRGTGVGPVTAVLPLPHFRILRVERSLIASDGQTVVVRGSEELHTDQVPAVGGDLSHLRRLPRGDGEEVELILFINATVQ